MKAVLFREFGGPENLSYEEVADPEINETEVLIRVRACALNHLDIWARQGTRGERIPMPHISGCDISGEVARVGSLVKNHKPGEKVLIAPGISDGTCEYCSTGWDSLCESYKIIGYETQGGYADFAAVPSENVLPIPDRLNFEQAASVPLVFLTAWHMLSTRARLTAGEIVLVWAAGSGVGSAAIQVAKVLGAKVIATAGDDEKLEKAKHDLDELKRTLDAATAQYEHASNAKQVPDLNQAIQEGATKVALLKKRIEAEQRTAAPFDEMELGQ